MTQALSHKKKIGKDKLNIRGSQPSVSNALNLSIPSTTYQDIKIKKKINVLSPDEKKRLPGKQDGSKNCGYNLNYVRQKFSGVDEFLSRGMD